MADHNANKIVVQVQVKPTPTAAEPTQANSSAARSETAGTNNMLPNTPDEASPDAQGTRPDEATPNAVAAGPPIPPMATGSDEGLPKTALAELEQIELDDSILDLMPREADDFEGVNLDFATALLEDGGEEIARHIAETYNPEAEKVPPGQDYHELVLGVDGLNLGDSVSNSEEPPKKENTPAETTNPAKTPPCKPTSIPDDVEMEEKGEPLHDQPRLQIEERKIQIKDIGLFRRRTGQPVWLRAYPWIKHPAVPSIKGKPQAYTGQDHHDPTGLYPRSTRKERQQAREVEQRAACQNIDELASNHEQALEYRRYARETLIQHRDQLWMWGLEAGADHHSLEMCDINTMKAIHDSGILPLREGGFNPITLSYLTVTLDQDKALLTAQEAMAISVAFQPLSERILTNDLYGIPLYQPSVGLIGPDQTTRARVAAAVIRTTGADPNFVTDRVVGRTTKPRWYEMGYRPPIDLGPMHYVCRVDDCHALGLPGSPLPPRKS